MRRTVGKVECYESNPEDDVPTRLIPQVSSRREVKQSEDVISEPVKPVLAFEKFAGRLIVEPESHTATVQHTSQSTLRKIFESPLDRYQRLKTEIEDFQQELKAVEAQAHDSVLSNIAGALIKDVRSLESQLGTIAASPIVQQSRLHQSSLLTGAISAASDQGVERAMSKIQSLADSQTTTTTTTTTTTIAPAAPSSSILSTSLSSSTTTSSSSSSSQQQQRLEALERRIARLEHAIGVSNLAALQSSSSSSSSSLQLLSAVDLTSVVRRMARKVDLLDPLQIDTALKKMKILQTEVDTLQENQRQRGPLLSLTGTSTASAAAAPGHAALRSAKVNEMFRMLERWDATVSHVPSIIARFHALKSIHEQAAQVVSRLSRVEFQLNDADSLAKEDRVIMAQVLESLSANAATMRANFASLDQRIGSVSEKLKRFQ